MSTTPTIGPLRQTPVLELIQPDFPGEILHIFYCPGCECCHYVRSQRAPGRDKDPLWTISGPLEKPTINPSVLIPMEGKRCHLFIRDGMIQFLMDCDHKLKGQTVPMEDV